MKQNNEIRFKLTTEEHDRIQKNADKLGLTMKEFILFCSLNSEVEIKVKSRE